MMSDGRAILRRYEEAKTLRAPFEPRWNEIAERILPRASGSFFSRNNNVGQNKNANMIDVSGAKALERFGAIMEGMLTPRMQKWHTIEAMDPVLNRNREVKLYHEECARILFTNRYAPRANFATAQQENYISVGAFGTGIKFLEKPREKHLKGIRYRTMHLGGVYLLANYCGMPDTVFRPIELNARQYLQEFNLSTDRMPECIAREMGKAGGPSETRMFEFVHVTHPRADFEPVRIDVRGMEFRSVYVCIEDKEIVRDGGYSTWPFPLGRYFTAPGELYGRGPGDMSLGAQKTLNAMKVTMIKQGHRTVDPVLLSHDDGVADSFNMTPGAMNSGGLGPNGEELVKVLQTGNLAVGKDMMAAERKDIDDIFLTSLFQILVERPEMTAAEFIGLMQEKGQLLAPAMGRQQTEDLGPMIERELDLLSEQKMLPPMPQILREAGGDYQPVYDSPLARAQKAEAITGFMRTTEFALNVAAQTKDASMLDRLNFDVALPEIAEAQAVPARWIRSDEELAAKREAAQGQQDNQTMIQGAPAAAQLLKAIHPKGLGNALQPAA